MSKSLTPFYSENGITLYNNDCIEVLDYLKNTGQTVQLVACDPPYGKNYKSGHVSSDSIMGKRIANDYDLSILEQAAPKMFDLLDDNCAAYFFAHSDMIPENRKILDLLADYKNTLIWDKGPGGTFGDLEAGYSLNYEVIFYYNKGRSKLRGNRPRTILKYPWSSRQFPLHPNSKSPDVMAAIIKNSTDEGGTVLDCFCGSGPIALACKRLGRKYIGAELELSHCKTTVERLKQGVLF